MSSAISIDVGNEYHDDAGNIGDSASLMLYVNTQNSTVGTSANNTLSGSAKADCWMAPVVTTP